MWHGNNTIFKTYVKGSEAGDGKRPAEKVKGRDQISTFEEVSMFPCFGGVLNEGYIDISFDSKEMYEAFLNMAEHNDWKCLCLPSVHGGHTYWKNDKRIEKGGRDKKLAVGLIADIHDKSTYIPLRVHGVDRFPEDYDIIEGEDYQTVPDELIPVNTNIELWDLSEGEGRNDTLFRYILVLQSAGFAADQIRDILNNTNQYVFREPMDQNELETVLRDEAFENPVFFDDKGRFKFSDFARYIKQTCYVRRVNDRLFMYREQEGIYTSSARYFEHRMIQIIPYLKANQRTETMKYLDALIPDTEDADSHVNIIAFKNGIFDIDTNVFHAGFSPQYFSTNRIPWNYSPGAYNSFMDAALNDWSCGDQSIRDLLEECIGYCFYRSNRFKKSFMLTGSGDNGKSTFCKTLKNLLGYENTSALDIAELGERFSVSALSGKLANIGDDIADGSLKDKQLSTFKKVVSGDAIKAEFKGVDAFNFEPYAKLIFSANDIPRFESRSALKAIMNRLLIVPFRADFSEGSTKRNNALLDELKEPSSMEYLIQIGLKGLQRIISNGAFTKPESVARELEEFSKENDSFASWLDILDVPEETILPAFHRPGINDSTALYKSYEVHCNSVGFTPMSAAQFGKRIKEYFNCTVTRPRFNKIRYTFYVK